jgi:hypothetical protein
MDTGPVETVWKTSDSPQAKITHLMETQLLPTTDELLVLAIDEADSLWVLPPNERTEFFSMLRSWLERAGTHAVWQKLRLLMAISTDPTRLINQNNLSPFNLRPPIKLQEMKPAQIHQLLQMHGLHWPEPTINELRPLLGGNIYLWRLVMYETALNEGVIPDIRPGSLLFEPELAYFQRWLRKNPACLQELAHFQDDSIKGGNDLEACNQLVAMGLLLQEKTAHYRLRCGLYRQLVN